MFLILFGTRCFTWSGLISDFCIFFLIDRISDDEVMRDMLAHVVHEFICSCHVVHKICLKAEQKADKRKNSFGYIVMAVLTDWHAIGDNTT